MLIYEEVHLGLVARAIVPSGLQPLFPFSCSFSEGLGPFKSSRGKKTIGGHSTGRLDVKLWLKLKPDGFGQRSSGV